VSFFLLTSPGGEEYIQYFLLECIAGPRFFSSRRFWASKSYRIKLLHLPRLAFKARVVACPKCLLASRTKRSATARSYSVLGPKCFGVQMAK
jgi:hypothetical protein